MITVLYVSTYVKDDQPNRANQPGSDGDADDDKLYEDQAEDVNDRFCFFGKFSQNHLINENCAPIPVTKKNNNYIIKEILNDVVSIVYMWCCKRIILYNVYLSVSKVFMKIL